MDKLVSSIVKEYEARKGDCMCCVGTDCASAMCGKCTKESCFKDKIDLKSFIVLRVAEHAKKEFVESDTAAKLKTKAELRKYVYDDFSNYVDSQKEFLDNMLNEYYDEYNSARRAFDKNMNDYISTKVRSALEVVGEKLECVLSVCS